MKDSNADWIGNALLPTLAVLALAGVLLMEPYGGYWFGGPFLFRVATLLGLPLLFLLIQSVRARAKEADTNADDFGVTHKVAFALFSSCWLIAIGTLTFVALFFNVDCQPAFGGYVSWCAYQDPGDIFQSVGVYGGASGGTPSVALFFINECVDTLLFGIPDAFGATLVGPTLPKEMGVHQLFTVAFKIAVVGALVALVHSIVRDAANKTFRQ